MKSLGLSHHRYFFDLPGAFLQWMDQQLQIEPCVLSDRSLRLFYAGLLRLEGMKFTASFVENEEDFVSDHGMQWPALIRRFLTHNYEAYPDKSLVHHLIKEIFGAYNYFLTIEPHYLRDSTVRQLLKIAYQKEQRTADGWICPDFLGVLADSLEEAGCSNPNILNHLRSQDGFHPVGCYVVECLKHAFNVQ